MVRCEICGAEVLTGWICGVVPANDRFKLGLCPEHDSIENRALVRERWKDLLTDELRKVMRQGARETESGQVAYAVTIHYLDGGVVKRPCRAYEVSQERELLVLNENGELDFYPLQHIRHFTVQENAPRLEREVGAITDPSEKS